ncbi:MAG: hypothetical protein ACD_50C00096G0006 [uncultured bacterium]|nr:MAG: hypothetical protein ACD_50C00096G0006 [uncultured bacterium]OGH13838.1 MAG: hypothetical protein A2687_04730 [Candidatus Levybacteria bacterium RIFCSPHIGHO2_01_FULL_38_26]
MKNVFYVGTVYAHESDIPHEESVPTISPMFLIWVVLGLGIAGFLLWKFVLHGHKSSPPTQSTSEKSPPVQEKNVSETSKSEAPSQSK